MVPCPPSPLPLQIDVPERDVAATYRVQLRYFPIQVRWCSGLLVTKRGAGHRMLFVCQLVPFVCSRRCPDCPGHLTWLPAVHLCRVTCQPPAW